MLNTKSCCWEFNGTRKKRRQTGASSCEIRFWGGGVTRSLSGLHLKKWANLCYDSDEEMRGFHLVAGIIAVTAFLITGQFMRHHLPPMATLGDATRLMFRSRHIYILAAGLVNLMLGLYLEPQVASWRRTVQSAGSVLLLSSLVPLILAFVLEPERGFQPDMQWSAAGLYALFGGCMAHFVSAIGNPRRGRAGKPV
jgi:hypothetical protein